MQTQLIEAFCISLGYFDTQIKIPFNTFLFTIGKLYTLLFIIFSDSSYLQVPFHNDKSNIENNFQVLMPFQIEILIQIMNQSSFQNYTILTANVIFILAIIFVIINYYWNTEKENIDENVKQNIFFNIFLQFLATLFTLFNQALIQPLLIFGLWNIKNSTINQEYFWIINCVLYLSFLHIISFIYYTLTEGALIIYQNQQKKIQITFFDYAYFLLLHTQPYIFVFSNHNTAKYIQSIIYFLIIFFDFISIFFQKVYVNQIQVLIIIIIHSCGFLISICNISQLENSIVYLILLVLFNIQIAQTYYNQYLVSIYLKDLFKLNFQEIHLLLCFIMSQEKFQFQKHCVFNAIKLQQHKDICSNSLCQCKKKNNGISDSSQFIALPDIILREIKFNLVIKMRKLIQNEEPQETFYIFCHFLFAQLLFGEVYEIYSKIENKEIMENFSRIQKIKWKIFIMIIKQYLFNSFTAKVENYSKDQTTLSLKINSFVQSESFNQSIKDGMINIIQKKIDYQSQMLLKSNNKLLIVNYFNLIKDIEKQENILQMIYDKFPSQKNQSQLMFYYAEIKHDWQKAYDKLQINAFDNQLNYTNDIDVNQLANKMAYLIFSFENRTLKIQQFSKKAPHIFGYDQKSFETIQSSDILIPQAIREIHNHYIEKFLADGKGHFFRKKAQNICSLKNGLIQNVEFFYDLYFDNNQCFRFIAFFCVQEQIEPTLLIDKNNKIIGLNKELLKKLNIRTQLIDLFSIDRQFYSLPATFFISENILNNETQILQFLFNFPKESVFQQILKQNIFNLKQNYLKKEQNLLSYDVTGEIIVRDNYKIVKFKKIQENYKLKKFLSLDAQSLIEIPFLINQEEYITHPYDENIGSPEDPYSNPFMIETQRKTDLNIKMLDEGEEKMQSKGSQHLIIYNDSESHITNFEDKTIQMLGNIYQQNIITNQDNFAGGSQASSMAGLRRSKFFRKYYLYNQLNDSRLISPLIVKMFFILILALLSQTIYIIINTVYSKQDFEDINYYYESVQINHYFIEPMQKFFLTRYMLQDYQITQIYNGITKEKFAYYQKFIMPLLVNSYELFKKNFQEHFQDESFSKFIEDKYVSIKQQTYHYSPVKLQEFNITLFNSFSILLDAFYKQQQIYVKSQSTRGTNPHNTFQYINYVFFVTIFDKISDEIYEESIIEIDLVVKRWLKLVIPITIIVTILFLSFTYYYNYFNHVLEKFFGLSSHVESHSIEADKQRQLFILQTLKLGSDMIYKYKFNLNAKEEMLKKKKQSKNKQEKLIQQETKQSYIAIKVSKFSLIISLILLQLQYSLISGPMTYVGTKYLKNFPETISFFKSVSDIGVYVPAAFSQKEMLYFFFYFSYLTTDDRILFVEQIEKAVNKIENFLNVTITYQNLQFSQEFLDQYSYIQRNDLCTLLNSSNYYDFDYFCYNSQKGILKQGLISTLNAFKYILKTELEIDFPQERVLPPQEELEAVYFCSDVMSEITLQMEIDIKQQNLKIEQVYEIINGVTLTFTLILIIGIYAIVLKVFKLKLYRTMMISLTFPLETTLMNDHFEREIRRIAINENLI